MRTAVHLVANGCINTSRVFKQTKSLTERGIVDQVIIVATWLPGLPKEHQLDNSRKILRVRPEFYLDHIPPYGFGRVVKSIKKIELLFRRLWVVRRYRPAFINIHHISFIGLTPLLKVVCPSAKLIYDTHELETESNGLSDGHKKKLREVENTYITWFDHVFVVSPSIEQWYRKKYDISNITTVMNCPVYRPSRKKDLFRKEFAISKTTKIFLYQGALFAGRGIEIMLKAFTKLDKDKYCLVIMGYGEMEEQVRKYSTEYENICFKEAVPPDVVLDYTSSADCGISLIENVCLSYYYCLPNKLFEYLMADIPCIVSNMLEMRSYVIRHNTGIICENNTCEALIHAIEAMNFFDLRRFEENASKAKSIFNWQTQEKEMIKSYNEL